MNIQQTPINTRLQMIQLTVELQVYIETQPFRDIYMTDLEIYEAWTKQLIEPYMDCLLETVAYIN